MEIATALQSRQDRQPERQTHDRATSTLEGEGDNGHPSGRVPAGGGRQDRLATPRPGRPRPRSVPARPLRDLARSVDRPLRRQPVGFSYAARPSAADSVDMSSPVVSVDVATSIVPTKGSWEQRRETLQTGINVTSSAESTSRASSRTTTATAKTCAQSSATSTRALSPTTTPALDAVV